MKIANTSVPVVALKLFEYCGVGMMRSLGRLGVRVYGIDASPHNPAFSSRYCQGKFVWNAEQQDSDKTISFLRDIASRIGERPILITNGDVTGLFVSDHAPALQDAFRFRLPDGKLARMLSHKFEMYHLAKENGVPTPETLFPQSRPEVEESLAAGLLKLPVMLKGADSALLEKRTGVRMVLARTEREVLEKYDELADPAQPNLMLQEYIPGEENSFWLFHGYFNADSDCLVGMAGRKLRQFPPYTGMTSFGVVLKNEQLEETTRRFLKRVGYQGIISMDYRFDSRDGQYKLLDSNPRIGACFRLFEDEQGLDVLRAYYLDLTGQPLSQGEIPAGRKWVVENNDLISFHRYRKDRKITFWQWLRSLRGVRECAWFAWDDPIPFLRMLKNLALHFWGWTGHKQPPEAVPPKALNQLE